MSIYQIMKDAIIETVNKENQNKQLSQKIIAWLDALISGNEEIGDKDASLRHLELIYAEVNLHDDEETEED